MDEVRVTKLPHEFFEGEEVLCDYGGKSFWTKGVFYYAQKRENEHGYDFSVNTDEAGYCATNQVIPYKGNEHMQGENITDDRGSWPEDYEMPTKNPPLSKLLSRVREGSDIWALIMVEQGYKVTRKSNAMSYYIYKNKDGLIVSNISNTPLSVKFGETNDWVIYDQ